MRCEPPAQVRPESRWGGDDGQAEMGRWGCASPCKEVRSEARRVREQAAHRTSLVLGWDPHCARQLDPECPLHRWAKGVVLEDRPLPNRWQALCQPECEHVSLSPASG